METLVGRVRAEKRMANAKWLNKIRKMGEFVLFFTYDRPR